MGSSDTQCHFPLSSDLSVTGRFQNQWLRSISTSSIIVSQDHEATRVTLGILFWLYKHRLRLCLCLCLCLCSCNKMTKIYDRNAQNLSMNSFVEADTRWNCVQIPIGSKGCHNVLVHAADVRKLCGKTRLDSRTAASLAALGRMTACVCNDDVDLHDKA